MGFTIEKNPRLLIIYRHFQEREIVFQSYEIWDRFPTALVLFFQNREERKQVHVKLDEGFIAESAIKKTGETDHFCLRLIQGSRFIEIYADVLHQLVEIHKDLEKEYNDLKSVKSVIENKIDNFYKLLKESKPKSLSECQKIFITSDLYNCNDPVDSKIMNQGLSTFFRNFEDYEKENIVPSGTSVMPALLATLSKRKRSYVIQNKKNYCHITHTHKNHPITW